MRSVTLLLILAAIPALLPAQWSSRAPSPPSPWLFPVQEAAARRLNPGQITAQALLGVAGGIGGLYLGGTIGAGGRDAGLDDIGDVVLGAVIGLWAGTAAGVQVGGLVGDGRGTFAASLLGSGLGFLAALGVGAVIGGASDAFVIPIFALPTLGSIVAYQVSSARREQRAGALRRVEVGFGPAGRGRASIAFRVRF